MQKFGKLDGKSKQSQLGRDFHKIKKMTRQLLPKLLPYNKITARLISIMQKELPPEPYPCTFHREMVSLESIKIATTQYVEAVVSFLNKVLSG